MAPNANPGELWRQQQRAIRHLLIDPRLRAQLDEWRKTAETVRKLLPPELRRTAALPISRVQAYAPCGRVRVPEDQTDAVPNLEAVKRALPR